MATTALPLPHPEKILLSASKTRGYREIHLGYGDGYSQVAPKGLNPSFDTWTVEWAGLDLVEKQFIETILDLSGSWGILTWRPPTETLLKKFRMTSEGYTLSMVGRSSYKISCTLKQVFDILTVA